MGSSKFSGQIFFLTIAIYVIVTSFQAAGLSKPYKLNVRIVRYVTAACEQNEISLAGDLNYNYLVQSDHKDIKNMIGNNRLICN